MTQDYLSKKKIRCMTGLEGELFSPSKISKADMLALAAELLIKVNQNISTLQKLNFLTNPMNFLAFIKQNKLKQQNL